jgi:hypothetical protein
MSVELVYSTREPEIDTLLQGIIGLLELIFPGRVRAYYLIGSAAEGTMVYGSDLDLIVVFKGDFQGNEADLCRQVRHYGSLISPVRLDLAPRCEAQLIQNGATGLKLAAVLLYGDDILDQIPLEPLPQLRQDAINGFVYYLRALRGLPSPLQYPLAYPQPDDDFFGYATSGIWRGGDRYEPGTRLLINAVTLGAALRLLLATGQRSGSKVETIRLYREHINDQWVTWLSGLYEQCKLQWRYRVPEAPLERGQLRSLLQPTLAFENDVLRRCQPYIDADNIAVLF